MAIKKGDTVQVHYTGKLEDGTVFDSSEQHGQPLEFSVGGGQLIKGFDEAVVGMEKGEEKTVTLPPDQAYGEANPQMTQKFPKDQVPGEVKPGMSLMVKTPEGQQFPAKVAEVSDKDITLDFNHPLAGKTLVFTIKVVDVKAA